MPWGDRVKGGGSAPDFSKSNTPDFSTSSSGWGSRLQASSEAPHRHGIGGFFHGVTNELEQTFTQAIPGAITAVTHPIRAAETAASQEYKDWAPFVKGYADLFLHGPSLIDVARGSSLTTPKYRAAKAEYDPRFYETPVSHLLSATLAGKALSAPLAAITNLGALTPAEATKLAVTGIRPGPRTTIKVGVKGAEDIPTRVVPRNNFRAARTEMIDSLMKLTPGRTPLIGEFKRAERATKKGAGRQEYLRNVSDPAYQTWQRAYGKLTPTRKAALKIMIRLPIGTDVASWRKMLAVQDTPEARQLVRIIDNPKVIEAYNNPTDKMLAAHKAGADLAEARGEILKSRGAITLLESVESPYRHTRIVRGAKILTKSAAYKKLRSINAELNRLERKKGRLAREGRNVGKSKLKELTDEATTLATQAARSAGHRVRLTGVAAATATLHDEVTTLSSTIDRVMAGDITPREIQDAGFDIPEFEGKSIPLDAPLAQSMGGFTNVEHAAMEAIRKKKREDLEKQLTPLRSQLRRAVARTMTHRELNAMNIKLEPDIPNRMRKAEVRLRRQIRRLEREHREFSKPIDIPQDVGKLRIQVLVKLQKQFEQKVKDYEKAASAETALHRETFARERLPGEQKLNRKEIDAAREYRIKMLKAQQARFHYLLDSQAQLLQLAEYVKEETGKLRGGGAVADLTREIEKAGRPQPFYLPDVPAIKEIGRNASPEGSIAAQRVRADVYDSRAILFRTGMLALHPDELSPSFLRAAKHDLYSAMHDTAVKIAVRVDPNEGLPKGHEWLKEKRGEHIPLTQRARGEHLRETEDALSRDLQEDLTSPDLGLKEIARDPETKMRLAVPKAYADGFRAETIKSKNAARLVLEKSLDVWRALILHARIPWLVNNIFGNTFLYALRFSGVGGMRAYLNMLYDTKGARAVRTLLNRPETRAALTTEDMQKVMPEQIRGTFLGVNTPTGLLRNARPSIQKAGSIAGAPLRALPRIDRATEMALRKAATNAVLRGAPEVRSMYKTMKKQGKASWREAALKALEDPTLRDYVVREVNDSLGDFLSLTKAERSVIRQVVPFYAWMREITRIAGRMAVDHPGRALILSQLAAIGAESSPQDVPSYLKGLIPLGTSGGLQRGISTHAASPFATVSDAIRGAQALGPGATSEERRAFYQNLNPFLAQAGVSIFSDKSGRGLAVDPFLETGMALPQVRALINKPSALYPGRSRWDQLYKNLGWPGVTYDPNIASQYAREGS